MAGGDHRISICGDGAYASRKIRKACGERGIDPLIRPRAGSTAKGRGGGDLWGMKVCGQLGGSPAGLAGTLTDDEEKADQKGWKRRAGYGRQ